MRLKRAVSIAVILGGAFQAGCGGGGGGGGEPATVPGSFSVSPTNLEFYSDGATPSPQVVTGTVTGVKADTLFIRVEVAGNAVQTVSNFVVASETTGRANVIPRNASTLGFGSYTSTITVYACTSDTSCSTRQLSGSPQNINVTYVKQGISSSANQLDYDVTPSSSPADLSRSITITGYAQQGQTWTASSTVPWLRLSKPSGAVNESLAVEASAVDPMNTPMANGLYVGTLTLTPKSGTPLNIPVQMKVTGTQINGVAPYLALSNESREVIIRGTYFDSSNVTGVKFGDTSATSFQIVSPTEIRATHPTLAAGKYPVRLAGAASVTNSLASLVVIDPHVFSDSFTASFAPDPITDIKQVVFDPARKAVHVIGNRGPGTNSTPNTYFNREDQNDWMASAHYFPELVDLDTLAMSADGNSLILGTAITSDRKAQLFYWSREPATPSHEAPLYVRPMFASSNDYVSATAIANDGNLIGIAGDRVGAARSAFTMPSNIPPGPSYTAQERLSTLMPTGAVDSNVFVRGTAGASADGSRVLLMSANSGFAYQYTASNGQLVNTGVQLSGERIELDRTGSRVLVDGLRVFDRDLQPLGTLPLNTIAATLSPDGSRVFAYNSNHELKRFNLPDTATAVQTWSASTPLDSSHRVLMTIAPDGQTLFVVGANGLLVSPVQ